MCSGFVVKQKTAVELRISDWSSDVCSSDLGGVRADGLLPGFHGCHLSAILGHSDRLDRIFGAARALADARAVRYFPEAARSRGSTPGKLVHAPHRTLFWSIQCVVRARSEEHTSELQSLMRISYAVFCLKKKKKTIIITLNTK